MKIKLFVLALLALMSLPVLGQDASQTSNTVSFNNVSFSFDSALATRVNIALLPATPGDDPMEIDAANTEFTLYGQDVDEVTALEAPITIRVYRTADLTIQEMIGAEYQQLQTLLTDRSDLAQLTTLAETGESTELPFLPILNAAQAIQARAQYIDTASLQGVAYVTIHRQDVSPFLADQFVYTFQGLSLDGTYYVSAVFPLNTDLFPVEAPADFDSDAYVTYLNESLALLNAADDAAFTPSLLAVDAVVQSISFGSTPTAPTVTATVETPLATATAGDVNQDETLGGLAGTWSLVSYGPAEAQQPVLPNAPITLTFASTGIGGSSGCNTYGGGFQYNGSALTFSDVFGTLIACADDINAQEAAYLGALNTASAFQINGNQLVITYEGGVLTFTNGVLPTTTVDPALVTATVDPAVPTATATVDPALPTATATP